MKEVKIIQNIVYIDGELSHAVIEKIIWGLESIQNARFDRAILNLSSSGGKFVRTLELIRKIEEYEATGFRVTAFVEVAGSAATILAISCQYRFIRKTGVMGIHPVILEIPIPAIPDSGLISEESLREGRRLQAECERIILSRTKITKRKLRKMMASGAGDIFDAKAALAQGLVDKILK